MAQDVNESTVKEVHGAVEKGGSISRVKTFRDANGKPIGKGPQERYTRSERDYKKHPQTANEKAHQSLWSAVCALAKQELADPVKRAAWQQRFNEQLTHATPDTPEQLVGGARKVYRRLDAFVRGVIHRQLSMQH
ncbi:MAG: hypothetical protein J6T19_01725 [Paludibacteraceae bacterium]|nr:hypothetical protein [Paludibacteraceae bacterium]